MPPIERGRRLLECMPSVIGAAQWDARRFENEGRSLWKSLRVGILDAGRDPKVLDTVEEASVVAAWDFMLRILESSPSSGRQILECVAIVSQSGIWLLGFTKVKMPCRLALWRVTPSKRSSGPGPAQVFSSLLSRLWKGGQESLVWDDIFQPVDSVLANRQFIDDLMRLMNEEQRKSFTTESAVGRAVTSAAVADDTKAAEETTDGVSSKTPTCEQANEMVIGMTDEVTDEQLSGKEVVQRLTAAAVDAMEVASVCIDNYFHQSSFTSLRNFNIARENVLELRKLSNRLDNLKARLFFFGPCYAGRTSLVAAMANFPLRGDAARTALTTEWHHSPSTAFPRLTMPLQLNELLQEWETSLTPRLGADDACPTQSTALPCSAEGVDGVNELLKRMNNIVWSGMKQGIISDEHYRLLLAHPEMALTIHTDFGNSITNSDADTDQLGELILVDSVSPDGKLYDNSLISQMLRTQAKQSDGMVLVVDASKRPSASDFPSLLLLLKALQADGCLTAENLWIVGNCIDKLPGYSLPEAGRRSFVSAIRFSLQEAFTGLLHNDTYTGEQRESCLAAASRLGVLGIYGKWKMHSLFGKKSNSPITSTIMASLQEQPWFAEICSLLYGVHWPAAASLRNMTVKAWDREMKALVEMGQIKNSVSPCILGRAWTSMLPRSIDLALLQLKAMIRDYMAEVKALTGPCDQQSLISDRTSELRAVFVTFLADVESKIVSATTELPGEDECCTTRLETTMPSEDSVTFEDVSNQPVLEFLRNTSEGALKEWNDQYNSSRTQAYQSTLEALEKWYRTVQHFLRKSRANAITRRRVSATFSAVYGQLDDDCHPCYLEEGKLKELILATARQEVHMTKNPSLFNRGNKVYSLERSAVEKFLRALYSLWFGRVRQALTSNFIDPIKRNFEAISSILQDASGVVASGSGDIDSNFSFVATLEPTLQDIMEFQLYAEGGEHSDAPGKQEREQVDAILSRVSEAVEAAKGLKCYRETVSEEESSIPVKGGWLPW
ncbi:hypothetical protein FOL47_001618 [Perkinsus chesapeaki]|uniref:Uncharacterized protein n=1 Tax=Perkinsus chesapeaki TaxID=330153 RepID=A0A7J6N107_PERCH|nr:hypothetical protein FOL47_001618 [Perkinsus chesapeaki]